MCQEINELTVLKSEVAHKSDFCSYVDTERENCCPRGTVSNHGVLTEKGFMNL